MSALLVVAGLMVAADARADDDEPVNDEPVNVLALPRLPAPMILPELTHPRRDLGFSWTVGNGATDVTRRPDVGIAIMRFQMEASFFSKRRVYAGVTLDYAAALPPDNGVDVYSLPPLTGMKGGFGNVEPHGRIIFPLAEGLVIGLGGSFVVPTSGLERDGPTRSAMMAAASLEPTDYVHFQPGRWGMRGWGDLRIERGLFVFQARQGFDIVIDQSGYESAGTAGRILLHGGLLITRALELSVEASQIYFFFTDDEPASFHDTFSEQVRANRTRRRDASERYRISDDHRGAYTIGPSLRLSFPSVDVGVGVVTNVLHPLSPALQSFVAGRVSVVAHFR